MDYTSVALCFPFLTYIHIPSISFGVLKLQFILALGLFVAVFAPAMQMIPYLSVSLLPLM